MFMETIITYVFDQVNTYVISRMCFRRNTNVIA